MHLLLPTENDSVGPETHIMCISGDELSKKVPLFLFQISVSENRRAFWHHTALDMVRLPVHHADKRLLNGNGTLQHGLHDGIISSVLYAAHIENGLALCDQWIDLGRIITNHTPARRFCPAAKAAHAI